MDSCGPQSHPSKLGLQGRLAGVIGHIDKESASEKELMRLLRNYFRRNYKFLRYNGVARMSCHFGPHYLQMEAVFCQPPIKGPVYRPSVSGLLRRSYRNRKGKCHPCIIPIECPECTGSAHPYFCNPAIVQLDIPFLYHAPSFSVEEYSSVFLELSYDGRIRFHSGNQIYSLRNDLTGSTN